MKRARSSWSDLDNDGDLDLLMATNYEHPIWQVAWHRLLSTLTAKPDSSLPRIFEWHVRAFYNEADKDRSPNNWLQIELAGSRSNPQAIGANVELHMGDSSRTAHVGQFENSLLSQGHYRIYFGLGRFEGPSEMIVTWPDGKTSRHAVQDVNRLVKVSRASSIH